MNCPSHEQQWLELQHIQEDMLVEKERRIKALVENVCKVYADGHMYQHTSGFAIQTTPAYYTHNSGSVSYPLVDPVAHYTLSSPIDLIPGMQPEECAILVERIVRDMYEPE